MQENVKTLKKKEDNELRDQNKTLSNDFENFK